MKLSYNIGDRVRIKEGYLKEVLGTVTSIDTVVRVLSDHNGVSINYYKHQIEPAPPTLLEAAQEYQRVFEGDYSDLIDARNGLFAAIERELNATN